MVVGLMVVMRVLEDKKRESEEQDGVSEGGDDDIPHVADINISVITVFLYLFTLPLLVSQEHSRYCFS